MYQVPNYTQTVSMRLSEVLADIGVDERIILKRRRTYLLRESLRNINDKLLDEKTFLTHIFGSQSEGTTTIDMQSDLDQLICSKIFTVIQDWSDWTRTPGVPNLLMIQDNSVSPGYCLLQLLRDDVPLSANSDSDQYFFKDRTGKLFFKNSIVNICNRDREIHGPAGTHPGQPGFIDIDKVFALHCTTWPQQARQWLDQQDGGQWPPAEIKQYCSRTGCFVVGVGCCGSEHEQLEWRISTSLAEMCLTFNLNITQIRCYILMKVILKAFITPLFQDVISSYMCKTVVFHCIANTHSNIWRKNNLLSCLTQCLFLLYTNIINENCPHFIIPGNNLMRGKISPAVKPYILEILNNIINSEGVALLWIKCDALGYRLHDKFHNLCPIKTSDIISGTLLFNLALEKSDTQIKTYKLLKDSSLYEAVEKLKNYISKAFYCQYEGLDKTASLLLLRWYCTTLGSVLASRNICQNNTVSADALKLISLGLNTDVASNKLKLASILYCIQEIQKADLVLSEIERSFDLQIVEPICSCHRFKKELFKQDFGQLCDNYNEEVLQYTTASCVRFLPCEIHCVPTELRYEIFRSTQEDRMFRTEDDEWMDCAVVDSLPYLYFLQYKVYSHLGRHDQKQATLFKLIRTIKEEPNLGLRETALNILGKCMEQEGRARDALRCYSMSLNIRRRNNAAKIHNYILLSVLINTRT